MDEIRKGQVHTGQKTAVSRKGAHPVHELIEDKILHEATRPVIVRLLAMPEHRIQAFDPDLVIIVVRYQTE